MLLSAIALDYCLGEPRNAYHPLVAFGRWAAYLETAFNEGTDSPLRQKLLGLSALTMALLPCLAVLLLFRLQPILQSLAQIGVLYFCIGARSLQQHALAIYQALTEENLPLARQRVAYIVSRQTGDMTSLQVRRATIESVLENGADAVFAPLFWFVVLGPFGAVLYRLANTLDAMWGYKNPRYLHFGWAAARLDDALNWIPARLTALSYALLGNTRQAIEAWRHQARLLESPNAGPVMTSGAGSLNLRLGGPAIYHGQLKDKPWFGGPRAPENGDINIASSLIYRTICLWLIAIAVAENLV